MELCTFHLMQKSGRTARGGGGGGAHDERSGGREGDAVRREQEVKVEFSGIHVYGV